MIDSLIYLVSEAATSLWRGRRSSALAILTIAAALFVLGVFLVLLTNADRVAGQWSAAAEFSVYLADDISDADRRAVETVLRSDGAVARVESVSKMVARDRFARDFPDFAPAARAVSDNPFPASFEVRLRDKAADAGAVARLAGRVSKMPGVSDVRYDRLWLDRLMTVVAVVRWLGMAISGVLAFAATLTVISVVRLALHARRDEIDIMALVGAPIAFIRGPFVMEGLLQGGLGAVIALAALGITEKLVFARVASMTATGLTPLSVWSMVALIAAAVVVGSLAGFAATKHVGDR